MSVNSISAQIQQMRSWVVVAQRAPLWALLNLAGFLVVLIDFKFSFILPLLGELPVVNTLRLFVESVTALTFAVNCAYNVYYYIWMVRLIQPLELSEQDFRIFGIREKEIGFKVKKQEPTTTVGDDIGKRSSPRYPATPSFEISNTSIHGHHHNSSLDSTALSARLFDNITLDSSRSPNLSWSLNQTGGSPFNTSNNRSNGLFKNGTPTNGSSVLRRRGKGSITSPEELESYLSNFEKKTNEISDLIQAGTRLNPMESNGTPSVSQPPGAPPSSPVTPVMGAGLYHAAGAQMTSPGRNFSFNSSFTGSPSMKPTAMDASGGNKLLESLQLSPPETSLHTTYQPAIILSSIPSPENATNEANIYANKGMEKVLAKLEVDSAKLNQMVENIRKWISQTILVRLVAEIEANNRTIKEKGYLDSLIGETSIQQLKHLGETKKRELPTLEELCAFLDINVRNIENNTILQKYLVRRIRDLAQGGCMSQFFWDGGGSYQYRHWREDMVTDSELILHLFCVYMDSRLLFNPTSPEGKPFTSQHFKAYHANSQQQPKSNTYIEQIKSYPPQFGLVLKGDTFDIPAGRNNLFYALLLFLHHIKVKNFGLLGRINLGPSGLNIAWVIDK